MLWSPLDIELCDLRQRNTLQVTIFSTIIKMEMIIIKNYFRN
jgi:hypothetical protein